MNIDVRKYVINNFKDDSVDDIKDSIVLSINERKEETLIGLGVMFELLWSHSSQEIQNDILHVLYEEINATK